jgi:hypothetical protein
MLDAPDYLSAAEFPQELLDVPSYNGGNAATLTENAVSSAVKGEDGPKAEDLVRLNHPLGIVDSSFLPLML